MTDDPTLTRAQVLTTLRVIGCASRRIDFAILRLVFPRVCATELSITDDDPDVFRWRRRDEATDHSLWNRGLIPKYTSSLDAALTIVPCGWRTIFANERGTGTERWTWQVTNGRRVITAQAPTAPLAVSIAAVTALPDLW
jgi:hypothetical protein